MQRTFSKSIFTFEKNCKVLFFKAQGARPLLVSWQVDVKKKLIRYFKKIHGKRISKLIERSSAVSKLEQKIYTPCSLKVHITLFPRFKFPTLAYFFQLCRWEVVLLIILPSLLPILKNTWKFKLRATTQMYLFMKYTHMLYVHVPCAARI